jgi:hypothetical protein
MADKQGKNREDNILPYMWKKGQSGNPAGRPKGKTMKEYAKEMLACQTEEERQEFLHGLPKEVIWKMAEGNATSNDNLNATVKVYIAKEDDEIDGCTNSDPEGQPQI